jgi:DNA-binding transcriptional MerR regulator
VDEMLMDIAEVAERCGVAPSALRFYEKRGLVSPAGRNGLRRTYRPDVLGRLTLIACARRAGFTIAQIAGFLRATPDDAELRVQMARKALELEEDIARLSRMRDSLRHASTCMHKPLVECPDFKRSFEDPAILAHSAAAGADKADHPRAAPGTPALGNRCMSIRQLDLIAVS